MSGSGDRFGEDIVALENVRQLESTAYLHEYTGVLADTDEQVRIITLAPELADIDAAVDAFTQVSDQWYNASANANIRTIRERDTTPWPWIAVPDNSAETLATVQPDLSPDAIETVIAETADALRTLGLYNAVHGHLSPNDIYLNGLYDESAELIVETGGFGLEAAVCAAIGEHEPSAYTAPELLDGSYRPSEKTDVYGLGAISYFALTSQPPIASANLRAAIRDGPVDPPSAYTERVSADIDEVVMQALSTSPADRQESPYTFQRAFLSVFDPPDFEAPGSETIKPEAGPDSEMRSTDSTSLDANESTESETTDDESSVNGDAKEIKKDDSGSVSRRTTLRILGACGVSLGGIGMFAFTRSTNPSTVEPPSTESSSTEQAPQPTPSSTEEVDETYNSVTGSWRMFGYDAARTGDAPSETGPTSEITQQWSKNITSTTSSPAIVNGTVYIGGGNSILYAVNAATGAEEWTFLTLRGISSSPAVMNGTVYVGGDNSILYAVDTATGEEEWTFETGDAVYSPAVVDDTVYVGSHDDKLYAVDATTGEERWASDIAFPSTPAVVGNTVYIGSSGGLLYAVNAATGEEEWTLETGSIVSSAPAVEDGTVYVGSEENNLYAVDAVSGGEEWTFQTGDSVRSSPAVADGTVYLGSEDNNLYAVDAATGEQEWVFETGDSVSSPAVVDGTIYAGSHDHNVYALSADDGTEQWSFQTGGSVESSPAVVDGTVYVGSNDGNVYTLLEQ